MRGRISLLILLLLVSPAALAMPAALIYVGSLIVSEYVIAGIILIVVGTVWGQAEQRKKEREMQAAARASYNAALKERTATVMESDQPHVYVYGKNVVVGSQIVDVLTSGDRDQYHHLVCVHADHESEAILDVAINGKWLGVLVEGDPDPTKNGNVTQGDFLHQPPVNATEYKSGTVFNLAHTPMLDSLGADSLVLTWLRSTSDGTDEVEMPYTRVGTEVTVTASHAFTCSYQWQDSIPRVRVIKRLGASATPADAVTMAECPTEYTATCTLDEKTATIIRLDLDCPEFQGGVPTVLVKMNGKKVHDVRAPAFPADTPACSSNNALCIADYLMSPMCGVPYTDLPLDDYIAAANVCEPISGCTYSQSGTTVTVSKAAHGLAAGDLREMQILTGNAISGHYRITGATSDTFTYTAATSLTTSGNATVAGLYTLNGTVRADQNQGQVLEAMAQSMAGTICSINWSIRAGVWAAPVMALEHSDVVGDFSWASGSAESDLYNGVKGQFLSAANNYVATDFTPYQVDAYVTADKGELWTNIDFTFTDDVTRIHNICRIMTEDQRNAFSVQADFSYKAWKLEYGDRITFTSPFLGQTSKIYRVVDKKIGIRQAVSLKLKEDAAEIWDQDDAVLEDATPNTNLPNPFAIAPLASLACSSGTAVLLLQADGTIVSRILAQWPLASTQAVVHGGLIDVEWKRFGSDIWQKTQIGGDATQVYLSPAQDGAFYNVRARTVNAYLNIKSDWIYATHQVIGKTELPTPVTSITATPDSQGVTLVWEEIVDPDRKDYLICDDSGGAQVWKAYAGSSAPLPAASAGVHTYRIKSRDTSKLVSLTEATCALTIYAPSAPSLSSAIKDGMIYLTWNDCAATHQVKNYEVRHGASWAAGTFVGRADAQSLRITPDWTGARTFWVSGIDLAGNTGSAGSLAVTVNAADIPVLTGVFEGDSAKLSWTKPASTLPIDIYELRYGASWAAGVSLGTFRVTAHALKAEWLGARTFWVAAIDIAGNTGTPDSLEMTVTAAAAPEITTQIIDNNVLLYWTLVAGTLPTVTYELRKGATWAAAELIGTKSGGFTSVFETQSGSYTYWVAAIDSAGNPGSPGSLSATVSQPPDYVLQSDYDSTFGGTLSNMAPHGDADGSLIVPVNSTETFAAHFTAHGWATPQAQIDAGYPIYIQPNATSGYYEETKDYGAVLGSNKITITLTSAAVTGTVAKSCKISVSADGSAWTDYDGVWQVYATNFRYVKVRITFTASGTTDLLEVSALNIRLDTKLKTITAMVSCVSSDSGGTIVYLTDDWTSGGNKLFVDVDAIVLTAGGTTPVTAVYDFTDTTNPLSLKILLFDNAGARVTGTCSMTVRGF